MLYEAQAVDGGDAGHAYWNQVDLALHAQRLFRGRRARSTHRRQVAFLSKMRFLRQRLSAAGVLQSAWRQRLVRLRFAQMLAAATSLQATGRCWIARNRLCTVVHAAVLIQSAARAMRARAHVSALLNESMVSDELWRLKVFREREARQIMRSVKDWKRPLPKGVPYTARLLDADAVQDCSEVYPRGWTHSLAQLEESAYRRSAQVAVQVSIGGEHTIALTDGGDVYTWGWGDQFQLGHGDGLQGPMRQAQGRADGMDAETGLHRTEPCRIPRAAFRGLGSGVKLVHVAAGQAHTCALSSEGELFAWGSGRRGQLGLGNFEPQPTPRAVSALPRPVVEFACGALHTAAILEGGLGFAWGAGPVRGAGVFVGSGDSARPEQLGGTLGKIPLKRVACGWSHTMMLTHGGALFGWGNNAHGQLGTGDCTNRVTPVEVMPLQGGREGRAEKALAVSCGGKHTMVLATRGHVFAFGWNRHGQLGLGDTDDRSTPSLVGGALSELDAPPVQVAAGWRHTLLLTREGIYGWGLSACIRHSRPVLGDDTLTDDTLFEVHIPQLARLPSMPMGLQPCKLVCAGGPAFSVSMAILNRVEGASEATEAARVEQEDARAARQRVVANAVPGHSDGDEGSDGGMGSADEGNDATFREGSSLGAPAHMAAWELLPSANRHHHFHHHLGEKSARTAAPQRVASAAELASMDADALRVLAAKLIAPRQKEEEDHASAVAQRPVLKSGLVAQQEKRKEELRREHHHKQQQRLAKMSPQQRQQQEYLEWRANQQRQQQRQQPEQEDRGRPVRIPGAQPGRRPPPGSYLDHRHARGRAQYAQQPQTKSAPAPASIDMVGWLLLPATLSFSVHPVALNPPHRLCVCARVPYLSLRSWLPRLIQTLLPARLPKNTSRGAVEISCRVDKDSIHSCESSREG